MSWLCSQWLLLRSIQSYWGRAKDWFSKTEPMIEALRLCSVYGKRQLGNHVSSLVSWWLNNHGVPSVPLICFVAGNQPLCVSPSPSTWQKLFTSSSVESSMLADAAKGILSSCPCLGLSHHHQDLLKAWSLQVAQGSSLCWFQGARFWAAHNHLTSCLGMPSSQFCYS